MNLTDAILARHSVRNYIDRPLEAEKVEALQSSIAKINSSTGLNVQLVLEEPKAFNGLFISSYGQFSGVRNYIVMAGPKGREAEEAVGYHGEALVLLAQALGLNTCWVGLTYKKVPGAFTLRAGDVVHCVISLGYGSTQGVQHPLKPLENFYEAPEPVPAWFLAGVEAARLAPTAINQQKFRFILYSDSVVEARALFSMVGYTIIDLGIAKYHFELAAGRENFTWK
ncbi:MAG: nitroreductase [Bacteroidales bacterium]|nr:nitroreductase [Bacteroidales bacterium]